MEREFDPYYKWLGIPSKDQPPSLYRLLSIEHLENDSEVIDSAANRLMSYLQELSSGDHPEASQKLLNEISEARRCLLNPERKRQYDNQLKQKAAGARKKRAVPKARTIATPATSQTKQNSTVKAVGASSAQTTANTPTPVTKGVKAVETGLGRSSDPLGTKVSAGIDPLGTTPGKTHGVQAVSLSSRSGASQK